MDFCSTLQFCPLTFVESWYSGKEPRKVMRGSFKASEGAQSAVSHPHKDFEIGCECPREGVPVTQHTDQRVAFRCLY